MPRLPLKLAIILAVSMIVLLVALTVGWVLLAVSGALSDASSAGIYWTLLSVGSALMLFLVLGVVSYLVLSIKVINLSRRQSNFIDSVTHELKSPIASLKLYLQTLTRHEMDRDKRAAFYGSMLEEVERLDRLINHMLDAGRVEADRVHEGVEDLSVAELLEKVVQSVCMHHGVPTTTVRLDATSAIVRARRADLEVVFRNLIDNAVKYAGSPPRVDVALRTEPKGLVLVRISNNGQRIPPKLRRKIFGRFVRLGSELERETSGTGLGLYIVRTLLRRLGGRISIHDAEEGSGSVFEVQLPGRSEPGETPSV